MSSRFCCYEELECLGYEGRNAEADLKRWREGRLHSPTTELIGILLDQGVEAARVMEIGAGVGAVHVALLESGASTAIDVDASTDYLAAARAEAARLGLDGRIDYRYGDVVDIEADLPPVDIVTLDSVICCYPHLDDLLAAATRSHPRLVGITYPRDVWWMRIFMRLHNLAHAIWRSPSRYFIHRHADLERWMRSAGYQNVHEGGILVWRVVLYRLLAAVP